MGSVNPQSPMYNITNPPAAQTSSQAQGLTSSNDSTSSQDLQDSINQLNELIALLEKGQGSTKAAFQQLVPLLQKLQSQPLDSADLAKVKAAIDAAYNQLPPNEQNDPLIQQYYSDINDPSKSDADVQTDMTKFIAALYTYPNDNSTTISTLLQQIPNMGNDTQDYAFQQLYFNYIQDGMGGTLSGFIQALQALQGYGNDQNGIGNAIASYEQQIKKYLAESPKDYAKVNHIINTLLPKRISSAVSKLSQAYKNIAALTKNPPAGLKSLITDLDKFKSNLKELHPISKHHPSLLLQSLQNMGANMNNANLTLNGFIQGQSNKVNQAQTEMQQAIQMLSSILSTLSQIITKIASGGN